MDLKIEGGESHGEGGAWQRLPSTAFHRLPLGLSAWLGQPAPSHQGSPTVWPPLSLGVAVGKGGWGPGATARWRIVPRQGPRGSGLLAWLHAGVSWAAEPPR